MGTLTKRPAANAFFDPSAAGFLPGEEAPLPVRVSPLRRWPDDAKPRAMRLKGQVAVRRLVIMVATMLMTAAGGDEMYDVLKVGGVTVLEAIDLVLFVILLAWIAFSFTTAVIGFFVSMSPRPDALSIPTAGPLPSVRSRTALLLPTYNENPQLVIARLRAMYESVSDTGQSDRFDWFLLSDTTDPDIWIGEEKAFLELRSALGADHLFYRHRSDNTARKAGNIGEWVGRFGAAYDSMIILDADSLMAGETIIRLAHALEVNPQAGLIQTLPLIVNAQSLFAHLQQFATRLYGPLIAAGNTWWYGSESNYWGHNAIIRVRAFAETAGLPELRGPKPFGGHILSHDFVEAALMRRAGWAIFMTTSLTGSFEEGPPSLIDFAARDRRWCQGNLQHLAVLPARGLHWVSRLHLLTGIGSYVTAPLWLLFLLLGILMSLQAYFVRPDYFPKGFSLFPTWPAQDPVRAAWVFAATMGLLFLPKLLAYIVLLVNRTHRIAFGGSLRVFAAMLAETVFAALIAPSMMIFQSSAVVEILLGRDTGWQVQRRSDGHITRQEIYRKLALPTLCGIMMAVCAYAVSLPLLLWMSPVILGLALSIPLGIITSAKLTRADLFATPEVRAPPAVVIRAHEFGLSASADSAPAMLILRDSPELLNAHLGSLIPARSTRPGQIDVDLAIARAKLEDAASFEQAIALLSSRETAAVLKSRTVLEQLMAMPCGQSRPERSC